MARQLLRDGWHLQSSAVDARGGEAISRAGAGTEGWCPVRAPVTVLRALVDAGVYPDPRFGLNGLQIPDSSDEFNEAQGLAGFSHLPDGRNPWRDPWWYRVEFDLQALPPGGRVWLGLDSLNYRADVWVNGVLVADREQIAGMFQRFRLDVTGQVAAGRNALAIRIHPVDHPGLPETQLEVHGKVRGHRSDLMRDVTEVMSIGYDCFPTVPDRNMGLVQDVSLEVTGPVAIRDPFVRAELPLPELNPATLTVSAELVNASGEPVCGTVRGEVRDPEGNVVVTFREEVSLAAGETQGATWSGEQIPALILDRPALWWPRGYGEQPLYMLSLAFESGGAVSYTAETAFGVRRIDRELHERDGAHGFRMRVNGERIFCRGGYILPEMMFDWDAARIETEMRYLAEANLNYVAFEDIANPPDALLDACDRLGLMFWNCFYGCYWMQPGTEYPDDLALLEACTIDLVKRYRNHPSLVIYMAQNEGETRQPVYEMWRRRVLELDDTRFLVPSGSFPSYRTNIPEWIQRDTPVGMNDYAPKSYSWQTPRTYYRWVRDAGNWMFMIESASASMPALESLERFLPGLLETPPNAGDPVYPLDAAWAHFGANSYFEWFDRALRLLYGEPADVRDYARKAHLMAYDQHRAFFEAAHHRMWEITSGFGEWKLNSAWPDVQWQLYDWFLRPTPSLYAIRKACAPLAVQLSPLDSMVTVVNNHLHQQAGLEVRGAVYDAGMRLLGERSARVDVPANAYQDAFVLPEPASAEEMPLYFVKLELRARDELLADNFYWLSPRLFDCEEVYTGDLTKAPANRPMEVPRQTPCMAELASLPQARPEVEAVLEPRMPTGGEAGLRVYLRNTGSSLAFFLRLRLMGGDGQEVLPVFWEDNYVSLLPGERKEVLARVPARLANGTLAVQVDGWNVPALTVSVAR